MTTIHSILREFREAKRSNREMGDRFEELFASYLRLEPYPLTIQKRQLFEGDGFYDVKKMKHPGTRGKQDMSVIEYNKDVTISGIPQETHEYIVNGKSALAWVMERYQVTVDKDSGIKNDPNDWAREHDDPQYILRLIGQVVRVSVETVMIVNELPGLEIQEVEATSPIES